MDLYPEAIERLIAKLSKLPSIGRKSAERMALRLVAYDEKEMDALIMALSDVKTQIKPCKRCGNLTDQDLCSVCSDPRRDQSLVCVVEDTSNLIAIEKSKEYRGLYHVLGGLISPMNDMRAEDINLERLLKRLEEEEIKEIILAISSTVEGEMTTLLLAELLKSYKVKVTKIASGIPIGGSLEYFDGQTLLNALEERREI